MAFTDRFISLPIQVYDRKAKELMDRDESEDSIVKINPMEIAAYRPSYDADDPDKKEIVSMRLKCGDNYLVYMTMEDFEKHLNNFSK